MQSAQFKPQTDNSPIELSSLVWATANTDMHPSMGAGIFGLDDETGSGYMMYSAQKVHQRFTGIPSSLAYYLVVVRLNGSQWQYCNNATWINFTPVASDRLLAELDFDNDTVKMLGWKQVYYSSASQALEERVGSEANAASQYVWNLGYVDDLVLRDRDTDSSGSVDERLYSLPDLRFSVMALASSTGAIVERFKYDAHGVVSVLDSAFASRTDSNYDWEFRHTGRRTDLETGLQFFRARYYSPELARFISRDPLGFVDGMSLYRAYFVPGRMDPEGQTSIRWSENIGNAIGEWWYGNGEHGEATNVIRKKKDLRDAKGCCKATNIRLICRTMPAAFHVKGFKHCYLVFVDENGKSIEVLSGQQIDEGKLGLSDTFWDQGYFDGWSEANEQIELPVGTPLESGLCEIYDCMYKLAAQMNGMTDYYQGWNNSNTFLSKIMDGCGLYARFPYSATGAITIGGQLL